MSRPPAADSGSSSAPHASNAGPDGPPLAVTRHAAGRVAGLRIGVRRARSLDVPGLEAPETHDEFAADTLAAGSRRLGDVVVELAREDHGEAVTLTGSVANAGDEPVRIESVVMGLRWTGLPPGGLRYLRHGWQSWSLTDALPLDEAGTPAFPSGEWLRGLHHAVGRPPADRAGWHESDVVSVAGPGRGAACLAGVLETGRAFGQVYWRREGGDLRVEVEQRLEVPLAPGERFELEAVRVALGDEPERLLEQFAGLWGARAGARTGAPFQAGWCSWYHFFHDVTEDDLLRNLEALQRDREGFPVDVVQLDDGYQRAIGDWLETNEKFPRGLAPVARDIRAAGFTPGLWTAPFCVVPGSRVFAEHPEWLLRHGEEPFAALVHPMWTEAGRVLALDTSRPDVLEHLEATFRALREMGFPYLKLDFLHAAAQRARAADPAVTRAARLRDGLRAVRRGAGDDAFLLGCGCPLGPAVGLVDGMRIGPDVAPHWDVPEGITIPGLEPALPSLRNALRSIVQRAWMHRRLWLNDPDCLMARTSDTQLAPGEVRHLAAAIAVTGGMAVFSDDLPHVSEVGRAWVRETLELAREVDAAAPQGVARALGRLEEGGARALVADLAGDALLALRNPAAEAVREEPELGAVRLDPAPAAARAVLGSPAASLQDGHLRAELGPREGALWRLEGARHPVVFCDFDGTFSVQDVGSTLARRELPERRAALWQRLVDGELTPWSYNMELLDGFELPESKLDAFLRTIDLDPAARELLAWCAGRRIPFRILSDGFDWNLDRLQEIHGVRFDYDANHLEYAEGRWSIAPGAPEPRCGCGTGTCKRGRIEAWRAEHPGAFCVHVGNGRVSDLCGALAADHVFAKDTLAPALDARGVAYEPFDTLHDVVRGLERRLGRSAAAVGAP